MDITPYCTWRPTRPKQTIAMIRSRFPLSPLVLLPFLAACAARDDSGCPDCAAAATVTKVASTSRTADGKPIRFPQGDAEATAFVYVIPAGAKLPVHKHPYPRFAYVMEGEIRVTLDGGKTYDYRAGDFIAEVIDTWHSGETVGSATVKLFVLDATPPGQANVVKRDTP